MDRIRNTMMQHQALFKEQVQALHELYEIQKSAMQEIMKRVHSPAIAQQFHSGNVISTVTDDQAHGSVIKLTDNREDLLALTLSPFHIFKEMEKVVPLNVVQLRNFDLEKLPEECMQESKTDSCLADVFPMDSQTFSETDLLVTCRTTDKNSEVKEHKNDEKNSTVASNGSSEVIKKATWEKNSEYFPASSKNSGVHSDSSHTSNSYQENHISCQDSSILIPDEDLPEQDQGIINQFQPKAPDNLSIHTKLDPNNSSHVDTEDIYGLRNCEHAKQRLELQEACETVAAKILLSFKPSKVNKPDRDDANIVGNTRKLCQRKHTYYTSNGGITDSFKWAKSIKRRSSRRAR